MSKTAGISLDLIRTNGGTQMRAELDQSVYFDYRDKWLAGVEFEPVDVFHDGSTYWLADGFHRFYGAREAKRSSIPARVKQGTQRDAILFAAGANAAHGLRRTNADKRQAVTTLLNDDEWVKWSDNAVAEKCHVTQPFVREVRAQLITVISSPAAKTADDPKVGRDGKSRKPRRKPMAKAPKNDAAHPLPIPPREPGEDPVEPAHKPKTTATVAKNGKATIIPPAYDKHAIEKAFGSLVRLVDDMARVSSLNNSPHHRECTSYMSKSLDTFRLLAKECDAVHARKK